MEDLKEKLEKSLTKEITVPSKILIERFCFLSEGYKFNQICADSKYFPFFYYLGTFLESKNMLEIGFGLGLVSGCLLQGCKTVQNFVAYQKIDKFYNHRMGRRNILAVYKNKFNFIDNLVGFKDNFDLVLVSQESPLDQFRSELDAGWERLSYGGHMVVDHVVYGDGICKKVLPDFCKVINRDVNVINSRYGTSIIKK